MSGGNILYLSNDGGDPSNTTNFNFLLEEVGMMVNSDGVIKTNYTPSALFHPKETLVMNGVLNREILKAAGKKVSTHKNSRPDAM